MSDADDEDRQALEKLRNPRTLREGWEYLFARHNQRLYKRLKFQFGGEISDAECEDVLADTWIKVVDTAATFAGRSAVYTWIWSIAFNKVIDLMKSAGRRWRVVQNRLEDEEEPEGDFLAGLAGSTEGTFNLIEMACFDRQWRAFAAAHPEWAKVIYLRDACDYSLPELGEMLGEGDKGNRIWTKRLNRWRQVAAKFLAKCQ